MAESVRAAIYSRISKDKEGTEHGVQRQEQDCRQLAERLGFEVVACFADNDISASTKARKPRPQYEEMMRRARLGEFGAVLSYSNSRLTRRPREFEDLIDLHERHGVKFNTVASGSFDLATADGRRMARFLAGEATAEAERTGERVARKKQQNVDEGQWRGGPRPFGFEKDGVTICEKEARVIREATAAVLAGRSLKAICGEIDEAGSRTSFGKPWSRHSLRDMLLRPRNAGLIHKGRVRKDELEIVGKAVWEPVVSEDEWRALSGILLDPARRTHTSTESKWLGSSIYTCGRLTETGGACGSLMRSYSVPRSGRRLPAYKCADHDHLSIMAVRTDAFVKGVVAELVRDPLVIAAMTAGEADASRADRERRNVLTASLLRTEADYDQDLIDARRYKAKADRITTEISEIEQRLADAAQQAATSPIFTANDPGAAFQNAPLDVQRAVLRSVLKVEVLAHSGARGAAWSSERLRLSRVV